MKKKIINIMLRLFGIKGFQNFYEVLLRISLAGMNYGNGSDFKLSGELNVFKHIKKHYGNKALIIFDVGANVGNYSKNLAEFFNSDTLIHSFEPSKKTFQIFLETTSNYSNIVPNNFGISDKKSDLTLYSKNEASGLASVYQRNLEHFGISMDMSEQIKLLTIDDYCKLNNIDHLHFLKLDIEGHELKALIGAKQMINEKRIDFIQFEFGGCNIDSKTYFQDFFYLLKEKYKIYRVLKRGLFEIKQYIEINEIFITVNYLAIKRD
jgi:FkbM family methyltransferase